MDKESFILAFCVLLTLVAYAVQYWPEPTLTVVLGLLAAAMVNWAGRKSDTLK
jgi:hypothetical protein